MSATSSSPQWQPHVSVIVPVYNRPREVDACIASLLESDYPSERLEIVVADNGSTDATPAVLERYGERIRRVHEPKRGVSPARNAALRAARGEVAAFTDSDCLVDPMWVARIVAPLRNPRVGAVGGRIRALPDGNDVEHFGERIHDHAKAIEYFRPAYVITMNLACRLDLLHTLGLFDERLLRCEDVDLAYRIELAGYSLEYVADAQIYHRNRSTVRALMREGYAHGYHAMKLDSVHREYRSRTAGVADEGSRPSGETRYSRELPAWRERMYWFLFDSAKKVGKAVGSLRASRLYDDV